MTQVPPVSQRIHVRRSSINNALVQVDLAYAEQGKALFDYSDADLHVFWSALAPYPLGRTRYPTPLAVYGGNVIAGWKQPEEKLTIRGQRGIFSEFTSNPPVTAKSARIPNAIQWYEGRVFWTIQGYLSRGQLAQIAESLRPISSAPHPR